MMKIFRAFFFFSIASALVGCSTLEKWNSSNRRTLSVRQAWSKQTTNADNLGFRKVNRMRPILFKDLVIQANALDGLVALSSSGQVVWKLNIENGVEASAAIINDRLFFGANDGQFYSVKASTGEVVWTFPTRIETLSEPLVQEGVVYFMSGNNSVYALDASDGKQKWLFTRQDPNSLSIRGGSKPAFKNGTLYIGFSDGYVVALLAQTGTVKWEKQLNKSKRFKDLDSNPLVEGDFLYILSYDDATYCLRSATGELVWKYEKGGYGSILLSNDRLYFATTNSEFVALNKETGKKVWGFQLKEGIATAASLYKGMLVFGESQGSLRFLDANSGKQLGFYNPGRGVFSQPTVDEKNNRVYFVSNEANLYSLEVTWKNTQGIPYLR